MHTLSAREFARQSGTDLMKLLDLAERGKTVRNIDLAEYGRFDQYGDLKAVKVPDRLMPNLGAGAVSESSAADAFQAGRESVPAAQVDGEPAEVEIERENPEQGEGEHSLPAKRPQKPTLMHQFGTFALYAGAAVGVGLAVKALLGSGNPPVR